MLWMPGRFFGRFGEFLCFLLPDRNTFLFRRHTKVGVQQEDIINVHLLGRLDADDVTVADEEPLWTMTTFDHGRRPGSSKVDTFARLDNQVPFFTMVTAFCRKTHPQCR